MLQTFIKKMIRKTKVLPEDEVKVEGKTGYDWLNYVVFPKLLSVGKKIRPNYAWGVLHGTHLAMALGIEQISVIEFGVAGGNGLLSLEKIAEIVEYIYDIKLSVYGFDRGVGLPEISDYRDLPNIFSGGRHPMDVDKLQKRIKKAKLILGDVKETVDHFLVNKPSPVAFCALDLDLYSSTMNALKLLEAIPELLLPRIHLYFDDITGLSYSDFNGERLAISDFNKSHVERKISPIYGLKYYLPKPHRNNAWTENYFMAHIFDHGLYNRFDGTAPLHDLSLK